MDWVVLTVQTRVECKFQNEMKREILKGDDGMMVMVMVMVMKMVMVMVMVMAMVYPSSALSSFDLFLYASQCA